MPKMCDASHASLLSWDLSRQIGWVQPAADLIGQRSTAPTNRLAQSDPGRLDHPAVWIMIPRLIRIGVSEIPYARSEWTTTSKTRRIRLLKETMGLWNFPSSSAFCQLSSICHLLSVICIYHLPSAICHPSWSTVGSHRSSPRLILAAEARIVGRFLRNDDVMRMALLHRGRAHHG